MRAMDSMLEKLRPLGLYHLTGHSLVEAELMALASGLDLVYETLESLEQEAFVSTAESEGLDMREQTFGAKRTELPLSIRKEMLLRRGAITVNDCTKASLDRALLAVGLRASVHEMPSEESLNINCIEVLDTKTRRSDLVRAASRYLPAHLLLDFDFGKVTWGYLAQSDKCFHELEADEYTWQQIHSLE